MDKNINVSENYLINLLISGIPGVCALSILLTNGFCLSVYLSGYAFRRISTHGVETLCQDRGWVHKEHGALFVLIRDVKGHLGVKWGQI